MALFDDEPLKKPKPHEIGQDLSLLSAGELTERIALLKGEIARLQADLEAKGATKIGRRGAFPARLTCNVIGPSGKSLKAPVHGQRALF